MRRSAAGCQSPRPFRSLTTARCALLAAIADRATRAPCVGEKALTSHQANRIRLSFLHPFSWRLRQQYTAALLRPGVLPAARRPDELCLQTTPPASKTHPAAGRRQQAQHTTTPLVLRGCLISQHDTHGTLEKKPGTEPEETKLKPRQKRNTTDRSRELVDIGARPS